MTWFQKFLNWFRTNKKETTDNKEYKSQLQDSLKMNNDRSDVKRKINITVVNPYDNPNSVEYKRMMMPYNDTASNSILDYIILNELMNNLDDVPQDVNNSNIEFDGSYTPDTNSYTPDNNSFVPDTSSHDSSSYDSGSSSYDSGSSSYDSGSSSYDSGSSSSDF